MRKGRNRRKIAEETNFVSKVSDFATETATVFKSVQGQVDRTSNLRPRRTAGNYYSSKQNLMYDEKEAVESSKTNGVKSGNHQGAKSNINISMDNDGKVIVNFFPC